MVLKAEVENAANRYLKTKIKHSSALGVVRDANVLLAEADRDLEAAAKELVGLVPCTGEDRYIQVGKNVLQIRAGYSDEQAVRVIPVEGV